MATRNIVPRATGEGSIGTPAKHWGDGQFDVLHLGGGDVGSYLAESTGYGIVSGCEPSISGLTVTVGAGVVHLADGTRNELSATNITLDAADSTNPRIDLVYITSAGVVAKVTGTAAASPVVPTLPSNGISVAQVSVAAGATTGTMTNISRFITLITTSQYGMTGNVTLNSYNNFVKMLAENSFVIIDEPVLIDGDTITASNKTIICVGRGKIYTQNGITISGNNNKISVRLEFSGDRGLSVNGNNNLLKDCVVHRKSKPSYITTQYSKGCLAVSGQNNIVLGGEIYNGGYGVVIEGSHNVLEDSYIHDTYTGVIVSNASTDCAIKYNKIANINIHDSDGADGILVKDPSRRIKIIGNFIDTISEHGMYVQSSDSIIEGNTVFRCGHTGIKLASYEENEEGFYNENSIISNNVCNNNSYEDIYLQNTCINTIVSNNILRSTASSISIHSVQLSTYVPNKNLRIINNWCAKAISIVAGETIDIYGNTINDGNISKESNVLSSSVSVHDNKVQGIIVINMFTNAKIYNNDCELISSLNGWSDVYGNKMSPSDNYNITYIEKFNDNKIILNDVYIYFALNSTELTQFSGNIISCSGTIAKEAWVNGIYNGSLKGCLFSDNVIMGCGSKKAMDFYGNYNLGVNNITDSTNSNPIHIRGNNSVINNNLIVSP